MTTTAKPQNHYKTTTDSHYKGIPLLHTYAPFVVHYLERILVTLDKATTAHPCSLAMRFDLRLPKDYLSSIPKGAITNFKKELERMIQSDLKIRRRAGVRVHPTDVRFIWCRESTESSSVHFHCCLLVNQQTYRKVGSTNESGRGLIPMVIRAWAAALKITPTEAKGTVHIPKQCMYDLRRNQSDFSTQFALLFCRLSYFAKLNTKLFKQGYRSFGTTVL